jgi:hypothetical protein
MAFGIRVRIPLAASLRYYVVVMSRRCDPWNMVSLRLREAGLQTEETVVGEDSQSVRE